MEAQTEEQKSIREELEESHKEIVQIKSKEAEMMHEIAQIHEAKKSIEEELLKIKAEWAMQKGQINELMASLETKHHSDEKEGDDKEKKVTPEEQEDFSQLERLNARLKFEQVLKQQAINKLHEIMNRRNINKSGLKRLESELTQEKDKFNQLALNWQKNLQEVTDQLNKEIVIRKELEAKLRHKEVELDQLKMNLTTSEDIPIVDDEVCNESVYEGFLSVPRKDTLRRNIWKSYFVVISNEILFYKGEDDQSRPVTTIDFGYVITVQSVTKTTEIKIEEKDLPRLIKITYMPRIDQRGLPMTIKFKESKKPQAVFHKGHDLMPALHRKPISCDVCARPMWNLFTPPPSLECQKCRLKIHEDHIETEENPIKICPIHYDPVPIFPQDLYLLAATAQEQLLWIKELNKKVAKFGYNTYINSTE